MKTLKMTRENQHKHSSTITMETQHITYWRLVFINIPLISEEISKLAKRKSTKGQTTIYKTYT